MKSNLEKKLNNVIISFTNKCLYFPCVSGRPSTEYPDHYWWRFGNANTLYIATANRTKNEIVENLFHALMEKNRAKIPYHKINDSDRYLLSQEIYMVNEEHIKRLQKPYQ